MEIMSGSEEFRNFQGNAGVGSSYISYSNRDVIKAALYQLQGWSLRLMAIGIAVIYSSFAEISLISLCI